jgi:hypothetical protein
MSLQPLINLYKFYRQRNNYLLVYIALHVSTSMGHPQVLQVSHIRLLNCNVHIPILYTSFVRDQFLYIQFMSSTTLEQTLIEPSIIHVIGE